MELFIFNILVVIFAFIGMEMVAWFTHKYIMHGLLWLLHKDHHQKSKASFFEYNDFFFLLFSLPGIAGLFFGMHFRINILFWLGLGITLYGFTYFIVHDIFIHQRFQWFRNIENPYFKAIRRAHKEHHKHIDKEEGECFGMLWVPLKFFKNKSSSTGI